MNFLDFDNVIKTPVSFYRGNSYDKMFHVTKNGIDYDWIDVSDIIVQVKKNKKDTVVVLELKKSLNEIELQTGYMTWHLNSNKTNISAGDYNCFEVIVILNNGEIKLWWDSILRVKERGYNG